MKELFMKSNWWERALLAYTIWMVLSRGLFFLCCGPPGIYLLTAFDHAAPSIASLLFFTLGQVACGVLAIRSLDKGFWPKLGGLYLYFGYHVVHFVILWEQVQQVDGMFPELGREAPVELAKVASAAMLILVVIVIRWRTHATTGGVHLES